MNSRGTWDNVQLVLTSLVLLHYSYITHEEIRNAVDAYTLQCRAKEKKSEYLELAFETVQQALRVSVNSQSLKGNLCETVDGQSDK